MTTSSRRGILAALAAAPVSAIARPVLAEAVSPDLAKRIAAYHEAVQAYDRAAAYLKGDHNSDIWDDLRMLKRRLIGRGSIDAVLRA